MWAAYSHFLSVPGELPRPRIHHRPGRRPGPALLGRARSSSSAAAMTARELRRSGRAELGSSRPPRLRGWSCSGACAGPGLVGRLRGRGLSEPLAASALNVAASLAPAPVVPNGWLCPSVLPGCVLQPRPAPRNLGTAGPTGEAQEASVKAPSPIDRPQRDSWLQGRSPPALPCPARCPLSRLSKGSAGVWTPEFRVGGCAVSSAVISAATVSFAKQLPSPLQSLPCFPCGPADSFLVLCRVAQEG